MTVLLNRTSIHYLTFITFRTQLLNFDTLGLPYICKITHGTNKDVLQYYLLKPVELNNADHKMHGLILNGMLRRNERLQFT